MTAQNSRAVNPATPDDAARRRRPAHHLTGGTVLAACAFAGFTIVTSTAHAAAGPDCSRTCATPACTAMAVEQGQTRSLLDTHARMETRASVFTSSRQENPAVAIAPDGRTVVVWESRRQEAGSVGLFAQAFDALGAPVGGEVHINQTLHGIQRRPDVIAHPDTGHIWFAWESTGQDADGSALVLRRFDDAGLVDGATNEIAINEMRAGEQTDVVLSPLKGGRVLVAWRHAVDSTETARAIATRVFNADGSAEGPERHVAVFDTAFVEAAVLGYPAVTTLAEVDTAVEAPAAFLAWSVLESGRNDSGTSNYRVMGCWMDDAGAATGPAFAISSGDADSIEPAVTATPDGNVALAWLQAPDASSQGNHGYTVVMQTIARGAVVPSLDSPVVIAAATEGEWKNGVALTALDEDHLLIAYNTAIDGGDRDIDIVASVVDLAGAAVGLPFTLTQATDNEQSLTAGRSAHHLVSGPDGRIAAAWFGNADQGDASAANLTFFVPSDVATGLASAAVTEESSAMTGQRLAWTHVNSDDFMIAPIPPIWDPTWTPQEPLLNPQGDGPDFGFEGVPGTGWTPPDPELAVGPEHIMLMTNGQIACFLKDGTNLWRDQIENSFGFWGSLGANNLVFDPEVLWDPHAQRFMAMACERSDDDRSFFLFAVSKDDRPETADDWWKYRLDVTAIAGDDIDSPNMAANRDFITLTADFFRPTDEYLVYIIDKNSVLGGGTPLTTSELIAGTQSYGVPVMWDADTSVQYMVQTTENRSGDNTTIIFHAIENPFSSYSRTTFTLNVPAYRFPTQPPQRGTSVRPFLFEPRFWSCQQQGGSIWAVHHVDPVRVRARWYEFDMNNWPNGGNPALAQTGEIDLGDPLHVFFPSIAVDASGNAAITFARSSSNEFISMGRAVRVASDAPGTFREAVMVKESTASDSSGRWGDYSSTQADPVAPGTFWGHHQFRDSRSWRTWVAQYVLPGLSLIVVPDPLVRGGQSVIAVDGAMPSGRVYVTYSRTGLGQTPVPQLNVVLGIDRPSLLASANADVNGSALLARTVPNVAPLGPLWLQAAEQGAVSNVVETEIVP